MKYTLNGEELLVLTQEEARRLLKALLVCEDEGTVCDDPVDSGPEGYEYRHEVYLERANLAHDMLRARLREFVGESVESWSDEIHAGDVVDLAPPGAVRFEHVQAVHARMVAKLQPDTALHRRLDRALELAREELGE